MSRRTRIALAFGLVASMLGWLGGTAPDFQQVVAAQPPTALSTRDRSIANPHVNPAGTLADAIAISNMEPAAAGPFATDLDLPQWSAQRLPTNVALQDFVVRITYMTPASNPEGTWKFAVCFWTDPAGNCYDLFLAFDGTDRYGGLGFFNGDGYSMLVSTALAPGSIDLAPGEENTLTVVVYDGVGILSGNTAGVDFLQELPAERVTGDVQAEAGFISLDLSQDVPLPVSITSFTVWDLSAGTVPVDAATAQATLAPGDFPVMPPAPTPVPAPADATTVAPADATAPSVLDIVFDHERTAAIALPPIASSGPGVLRQSTSNVHVLQTSNIAVTDFYATVTFVNPADMSKASDIGIAFRDALFGREYRFMVETSGTWWSDIGGGPSITSGDIDGFDASPGATNTIEIIASGPSGLAAVNGRVVAELDLSSTMDYGAVQIGSGWASTNAIDFREVPFQNFRVYALPA